MSKKILIVFGTRPEAIKMAPLCLAVRSSDEIALSICVTGQHRKMLDQVLRIFGIIPDFDLDVMADGQDLFDVTSKVLLGVRDIIKKINPDLVLVHGDTTTAFATSLAAFYMNIPLGHVEAGLRTTNLKSPFPEEFNRRTTGIVSNLHFAPTQASADNLLREGVSEKTIFVTGNTVIDALYWVSNRMNTDPEMNCKVNQSLNQKLTFDYHNKKFILITGHRRENFGQGFAEICKAIRELAKQYPKLHFIFPVHLNPKVLRPVNEALANLENVHLIAPLAYLEFVYLMRLSYLVLTDSGGVQEEAPSLGKPVLVMRDTTERTEALDAGTVRLVGTSKVKIKEAVSDLLENPKSYALMASARNPYGDGKASDRILENIKEVLK